MHRMKKILMAHYRVGKTDGVSLEIEKRKKMLEEWGHQVFLISGPVQIGADFVIDEWEFDDPQMEKLWRNSIVELTDYEGSRKQQEEQLQAELMDVYGRIRSRLEEIFRKHNFDMIFVHNMLSMAINLPATMALEDIIREGEIPTVAVHHDFYWEGDLTTTPTASFVSDLIDRYLVPNLPYIRHATINTLNHRRLSDEKAIEAWVNYDVFDFDQARWREDEYNSDFRISAGAGPGDLLILQATRIVPNKTIEFAIEFARSLSAARDRLEGRELYDGRVFSAEDNIILILSGYTEQARAWYREALQSRAAERGVQIRFLEDIVASQRGETADGRKIYSLWDSYVSADLVSYPSIWEGWGNQFIEAVFAGKPVVVFEYPVFIQDIAPEGYDVISLGSSFTPAEDHGLASIPAEHVQRAAEEAVALLTDASRYRRLTEANFRIGRDNHSSEVLEGYLRKSLDWMESLGR